MEIKWISPEETHNLRALVLQRIVDKHKLSRPGDEQALHLGAFVEENLVGIASFFQQDQEEIFFMGQCENSNVYRNWC